jgi:hypothetical protein
VRLAYSWKLPEDAILVDAIFFTAFSPPPLSVRTCFYLLFEKTLVGAILYCEKGSGDTKKEQVFQPTAECPTTCPGLTWEIKEPLFGGLRIRLEINEAYRSLRTLLEAAANILEFERKMSVRFGDRRRGCDYRGSYSGGAWNTKEVVRACAGKAS